MDPLNNMDLHDGSLCGMVYHHNAFHGKAQYGMVPNGKVLQDKVLHDKIYRDMALHDKVHNASHDMVLMNGVLHNVQYGMVSHGNNNHHDDASYDAFLFYVSSSFCDDHHHFPGFPGFLPSLHHQRTSLLWQSHHLDQCWLWFSILPMCSEC